MCSNSQQIMYFRKNIFCFKIPFSNEETCKQTDTYCRIDWRKTGRKQKGVLGIFFSYFHASGNCCFHLRAGSTGYSIRTLFCTVSEVLWLAFLLRITSVTRYRILPDVVLDIYLEVSELKECLCIKPSSAVQSTASSRFLSLQWTLCWVLVVKQKAILWTGLEQPSWEEITSNQVFLKKKSFQT